METAATVQVLIEGYLSSESCAERVIARERNTRNGLEYSALATGLVTADNNLRQENKVR